MSTQRKIRCFFFCFALFFGVNPSTSRETSVEPCPKACVCSGNPDSLKVDCSNLNLTSVPSNISSKASLL
ncbi:hypothetical protein JTE90_012749 [Oedothorax gibbosus]|uniref:LRRNT domain-containing protein n=1 Tax=Oedothorax gibbosus TaxID=931172 RepID=A0AAV6W2U6_9ARAC|nr:hypothetical protein JTE90_012749 [Oedothorax gibbosus]